MLSKLEAAEFWPGPGIVVTDGDPQTGASENSYKLYEFDFDPVLLRYLRFTVTEGDVGNDSNGAEMMVHEVFPVGTDISLQGSAQDSEDGDLTNQLTWTSSLDGHLGYGASVVVKNLSAGIHTVTAAAVDSKGTEVTDQVTIRVARSE